MVHQWLFVFTLMLTCEVNDAYYPMVLAAPGTCTQQLGNFRITGGLDMCQKVTGTFAVYCDLDMCLVPDEGRIASGDVWSVSPPIMSKNIASENKFELYSTYTEREVCELLTGELLLTAQDRPQFCYLAAVKQSGADKNQLTDVLTIAGKDQCRSLAVPQLQLLRADRTGCKILRGEFVQNSEGNRCKLDLCFSEAVNCEPSDEWRDVQECRNQITTQISCGVTYEQGVSKTDRQETTSGGSTSLTVGFEVGVELSKIFTAKLSTSVAREFQWSETAGRDETWSSVTKHSISVPVPSGTSVRIQQLVGTCNDFRVKTHVLRVIDGETLKTLRTINN